MQHAHQRRPPRKHEMEDRSCGRIFQLKCQLLENVESPIIIWMARKQWGCKGCSAQVPTTLTD